MGLKGRAHFFDRRHRDHSKYKRFILLRQVICVTWPLSKGVLLFPSPDQIVRSPTAIVHQFTVMSWQSLENCWNSLVIQTVKWPLFKDKNLFFKSLWYADHFLTPLQRKLSFVLYVCGKHGREAVVKSFWMKHRGNKWENNILDYAEKFSLIIGKCL